MFKNKLFIGAAFIGATAICVYNAPKRKAARNERRKQEANDTAEALCDWCDSFAECFNVYCRYNSEKEYVSPARLKLECALGSIAEFTGQIVRSLQKKGGLPIKCRNCPHYCDENSLFNDLDEVFEEIDAENSGDYAAKELGDDAHVFDAELGEVINGKEGFGNLSDDMDDEY